MRTAILLSEELPMNCYAKGNILLLRPEGRIDANNAPNVESEIFGCINRNSPKYVVIDAEKLEYISSAGLRVVLKVKKAVNGTQIVNASPEVYEIFDMTGFTDMINITKAFRKISVEDCPVEGKSLYGTTYKLNSDTIVKLYNSEVPFDDIIREKENAKAAFICGVPTAIPFDTVRCGDRYGTVYELIDAVTLADVINHKPDGFSFAAEKAVEVLKLLSSIHYDGDKLEKYIDISRRNAETLNNAFDGRLFTADEMNLIYKLYGKIPERDTIVHGNFHTRNAYVQNGELVLINMIETGVGHPIYEFANMYLPFIYLVHKSREDVAALVGIDHYTAADFFAEIVRRYFKDFSEEDYLQLKDVMQVLSHIKLMSSSLPAFSEMESEKRTEYLLKMKERLNEIYFSRADEVLALTEKVTAKF